MPGPSAFICGCRGLALDADERAFLKQAQPLGVILFARNVGSPEQLRALTSEIRSATGGDETMVLVDQEGGRVQRLRAPHWRRYPAAARFAAVASLDERVDAVRAAARLLAEDLAAVGIDVDCMPVLDVPVPGAHDVIGDRAYASDPAAVAMLGRAAAEGLMDGGVLPVMKHVPGHGRAGADSHLALPVVDASRDELERNDFEPFRRNRDLPAAMTAHVVYAALDPQRPATVSPTVIADVVRGAIGFDGLLFSDDLSMKALAGSFREKAVQLFAAGVDVALHCSGDLAEATAVAEAAPFLAGAAGERFRRARAAMARDGGGFDREAVAAMLDRLLPPAA